MIWFSIIGWIGTVCIVAAFALKRTLTVVHIADLNILGAALLAISFWHSSAWPGVALQLVWIGVAVFDLVAEIRRAGSRANPVRTSHLSEFADTIR